MAKSQRSYWQRTRRLAIWLVVVWCLLVIVVPLAAPQLEAIAVLDLPLSYYAGAQGVLVALVIVSFLFAYRQRRIDTLRAFSDEVDTGSSQKMRSNQKARALIRFHRIEKRSSQTGTENESLVSTTRPTDQLVPVPGKGGVAGITGALAMAADWLSGATMVAIAGALYSLGHDGLAWLLGLFGGAVLAHVLVGPHLQRAGGFGVAEFISGRFGGLAGTVAIGITIIAAALLVGANIKAIVIALGVLLPGFPVGVEASILAAVVVFAAAALSRAMAGLTRLQAAAFPLLLASLVMPLALIALSGEGARSNPVSYGGVLQAISNMELDLLERELADPVTLKAYVRPLTSETATSGMLLVLSVALGFMAMPHVSRRPALARSGEGARLMPALAVLLVFVGVLFLPPMAALARHSVMAQLVGKEATALTSVVYEMGGRGLVQICGVPAISAEAVAKACAAQADWPGRLRLDDIVIARDHVLFALPLLMGLPVLAAYALAVAVIGASLLAIGWLGSTLAGVSYPEYVQPSARLASVRRIGVVVAATMCATLAAVTVMVLRDVDILTLIGWAMAVAAAGLAPSLIAGIWSKRATSAGAIVAMLAGAFVTLYYIVGTRYFAAGFHEMWGSISGAGYGAIAEYEAAKEALTEALAAAAAEPGSMQTQEAISAAHLDVAMAARGVADWWGIKSVGSGVVGALVGSVLIVIVSFISPRPGAVAVSVVSHLRGLAWRV
ncbi:MAG: DUF4212 domain-containing protein [Hyphomicrobiaceae bacterium]|nr:DUF4212 domain-containing protein [Hyphomicrobiaceae bacterium]